jgi:hypothetical protein
MIYSYTSISMWHKCPAKYDFRYNKKLKEPKTAAASRGTDIHSRIENYLKGTQEMPPEVQFGGHLINDMKVRNFMAEVQFTVGRDWKPAEHGSGSAWITSYVDSFLVDGNTIHMGEWKTGRVYDNHEEQRDIYLTMSLSSSTPEVERAVIKTIYLDQGVASEQWMVKEILPAHQKAWEDKAAPLEKDIFFSPRPGQHCKWCGFARSKGGPCDHG